MKYKGTKHNSLNNVSCSKNVNLHRRYQHGFMKNIDKLSARVCAYQKRMLTLEMMCGVAFIRKIPELVSAWS